MDIDKIAAKRSRAHQRYYKKDGTLVPGVTTVLSVLNKPALGRWHNQMGLNGIDTSKYVDTLAEIGNIAHDMICCHNKGVVFDKNGHADELVDRAENSFLSYLAWEKNHIVEPILSEEQLVSEKYGYGGTLDALAKIDGVPTLVDYKTGKAIYPEYSYQCAAYLMLLREHGHDVAQVRILQIGRSEDEGFSEKVVTDTAREEKIFLLCLELHKLKVSK